MPRMRILTANEQEAFDRPPAYNHRDRKKFFDFPKSLLTTAATSTAPLALAARKPSLVRWLINLAFMLGKSGQHGVSCI